MFQTAQELCVALCTQLRQVRPRINRQRAGLRGRQLRVEPLEDRRLLSLAGGDDGESPGLGFDIGEAETLGFVPGEILVGFEGEAPAAYHGRGMAAALDTALGAVQGLGLYSPKVLMDVPAIAGRSARLATRWQLAPGSDVAETARQLAGRPGVAYAEPNYVWSADVIPDDLRFGELWGMHNTGQTGGTADADIDAPEAWNIATGSQSIVAAVIDTGVDYSHPDLAANIWTNPGEVAGDGIDNDGNGFVDDVHGWDFVNGDNDPMDDNGHGTHVSGTIAAVGDNAAGVAGVNWSGQVMALKFLGAGGSGTTSAAVEAVDYVTNMRSQYGVNVLLTSNSWGGGSYSQALYDAIAASGQAGMLFIAAAGNNNTDNDASPNYPSSYDLDNIVAVAATDASDAKASFSSFGLTSVDLAAPGVDILSTLPGADYGTNSGTSMATPHVSGVAALAWSLAPDASPAMIKQAILAGADPIDSMAGMTVTGGRLNAYGTLRQVGMTVAGSNPAAGAVITMQPLYFVIDFSFPVLASSLEKEDLLVNGTPADRVVLSGDRLQATFYFNDSPVETDGVQTMAIAAGTVETDSLIPASPALAGWQAEFRYDSVRMTPLPDPANGSTRALPWNTLTISLNEDCVAGSVGTDDLVLSQGAVEGATVLGPRSIQYTLAGLDEGELVIVLPAGAIRDSAGNPSLPLETMVYLDFGTLAYPGELLPVEPAGSLVYDSEIDGAIGQIGDTTGVDTDQFQIELDAGQTLTVIAEPVSPTIRAFDGHGYLFSSTRTDWWKAQQEAAALGGYLVSINTQDEQQFLEDNFLIGDNATKTFWIGLSDEAAEGVWNVWTSGEPVTYTNWQPGEPNDNIGQEDYGAINWHAATSGAQVGTWNDLPLAGYSDGPYGAIIELPGYVPEEPLLLAVAVQDPIGTQLGAACGSITGQEVILSTLPVETPGIYTITVGSAILTEGRYLLRLILNTAVEDEEHDGAVNNSLASAQSLETAFIPLAGGTASRAAVLGQTRNPEPVPGPVRTYAQTTPVAIPDAGTVTSTLTIDDSYLVDDINVHLDISHTYDTDLDVFLVAPDGTRVELFTDVGGSANHFTSTILDDEATISIAAGSAPFTGVFRPEGRLSDMDLHNVHGTWTLEITDDTKRDRGTLNHWSLEISEVVDAPDFYRFQLDAGQIAALVLNAPDAALVDLELWGPDGMGGTSLMAEGTGGMVNADQAIENFAAPRAGTYYARVNGAGRGWDYALMVLRDAAFELESNENAASAFPLGDAANVLGAIDKRVNLAGGGVIESFEDQDLAEYEGVSSGASVAAEAAHDGGYGLSIDADWIRRIDDQVEVARGDLISAWVRFPAAAAGRAYFGFGSTPSSTLAVTLGPNTGQLLLHRVSSSYQVLASVPQTWVADRWYRVEVEWQTDGDLVGRLYDSDGITLLNKVMAHDDTITSGGIAFRGFSGAKHFDTIQVGSPSPDFYQLSAVAGDRIDLNTTTPLGGPGLPANELDPTLRLYDASGRVVVADDNSADGRNAALSYIVPPGADGDYFVEVTAVATPEPTFGQYELAWSKTAVTTPILFVSDAPAIEGDVETTDAAFIITLMNPPAEGDVSVTYRTENGTADGSEYDAISDTTVTLNAGTPSIVVPVDVYGDVDDEIDETFFLAIDTTTAGVAIANGGLGTATILNDDAAASIADVRIEEGDSGSVDAVFTVTLSRPCATDVTIGYATADGTATVADKDYLAAEGTLVIPAGETAGSVTVQVVGDTKLEPEETFLLRLSNPQGRLGLTLADGEALGTIHGQEVGLPLPSPAGLLSWWTGDGNTLDLAGPNDGTLLNGASYTTGAVGQAFTFDGVNDMVEAPATGLPTGNSNRTLELWVCADSLPASGEEAYFAGYGAFGSYNQTYHLGTHGSELFFSQWGNDVVGPSLTVGRWYHVAVANNGNEALLYLDGAEVGRNVLTIDTPPNTSFFMGTIPGSLGDIRKLDGAVDEVTVYDRALSAEEILSIYHAGAAGKVKGPGVTVHPISGLVTTEDGGSDSFGVVLNTQPNADVTIEITSSDSTEAVPSATTLVFTPDNWNVPQTVSVVGVDDLLADGKVAYTIRLAPAVSADPAYNGLDPADVAGTNLDDEGFTYPSADVPKAIPDRGKVTSTLTIPDSFTIGDLNVELRISHTRDEDLDVFLIAPDGTRVELFTDVGGTGDHFLGTILDDEADQPVSTGAAPFSGAFRPEGSLSVLRGKPVAGTWTLEITDDTRKETGTLTAWSLIVTPTPGGSAQLAQTAAGSRAQAVDRAIDCESFELAAWFETFEIPHRRTNRKAAEPFDTVLARNLYLIP